MTVLSKTFFAIALAIAATLPSKSQTFAEAQRMPSYAESMQERIAWSDGPIGWNNFQGYPNNVDTLLYEIHYESNTETMEQHSGRTTYYFRWPKTYLVPEISWVKPEKRNDLTLKFVQTQFDLWELISRKALLEYNSTTEYVDWNELTSYYNQLFNRRKESFYLDSEKATNKEYIDFYSDMIRKELDTLDFQPKTVADTMSFRRGAFFSASLQTRFPLTDYASVGICADMDFGFYIKKHMIAMDMAMGYAKCKKDIYESDGVISKGDAMLDGSMNLYYGHLVKQNAKITLTTFAGIGVNFYNGGEKYEWSEGEDKQAEKAGFTFGIGAMMDFPIRRKIDFKTRSLNIDCTTHAIRIKPYFSCTKYHGDMGLVPAFNIAIGWSICSFE